MRLKWRDAYSECGHYMIQTARPLHTPVEHRLLYSREGGPPYGDGGHGLGVYDTKREAKAAAQRHADRVPA